ncbi:efflux-type transporter [Pseudoscardovia radai]|uniref:Efflux-type transporter n=1 Tax=Pseudoscardovia radai TaxID=987066 RepID=A0A261EX66_9BIFI|nr:MFS transporter [Pseudoscardovia radai]OZG51452.1 efflux-type transporter [Pseudoscardovia radai]
MTEDKNKAQNKQSSTSSPGVKGKAATAATSTASETPSAAAQTKKAAPGEFVPPQLNVSKVSGKLVGSIVATAGICFVGILTETMMNVLFPHLMGEFGIDAATVQWVTSACILTVAATIPVSAFLKKRFLYKQVFLASVILAIVGGLIAMWSPSFAVLIVARIIQGLSTGICMPLMFNVVLEQSPRAKLGMLMGLCNLVVALAPALGPTFGGLMIEIMPWRHIFVIIIALIVAFGITGAVCLHQSSPVDKDARISVMQTIFVAGGFALLIFGLQKSGSWIEKATTGADLGSLPAVCLGTLIVGIVFIALFARLSLFSDNPLINLRVLRHPALRCGVCAAIFTQFIQLTLSYVVPNFSQMGLGASSLQAGLTVLPGALIGAVLTILSGRVLDRRGPVLPIACGVTVLVLGLVYQAVFTSSLTIGGLMLGYAICEIGFSNTYSNMFTVGLRKVPGRENPDGNALFNTMQQFGCAFGTTVSATTVSVFQATEQASGASFASATVTGAHWAYVFAIVAGVIAAALIARELRHDARAD